MTTATSTNGSPAVARKYIARGWAPIPLPPKTKAPNIDGWEQLRIAEAEVPKYFRANSNVGVLNGAPSHWLVDLDLDHPLARELADEFLPATGAEFGRASSRRSHRLYRVTSAVDTLQRRLPKVNGKAPMIVELRSTGSQTVFPGSVHPEGERIEWDSEGEPLSVSAGLLIAATNALADEVEKRLGVTRRPVSRNGQPVALPADVGERARKYLAKVPPAVSGAGGHDQTFHAACVLTQGFALERGPALALLTEWNQSCQPPWSERELEHKIDDALGQPGERGYLLNGDTSHRSVGTRMQCDPAPASKTKINTSIKDLAIATPLAWDALTEANDPPTIFRYGGIPSRLERGDTEEPIIRGLDFHRMRYELARAAIWIEYRKKGKDEGEGFVEHPTAPPMAVVHDVLATPDQPLPVLTRIVEAPVFAPDGTLQTSPGYHPSSQTFYAPADGFSLPDVPNRPEGHDVESARILICDELLGDFPFVSDAERAHAVALLLLPFARDLIAGPTPLHLLEKPSPGTGASLLTDMLLYPATGRPIPTMTEGRDEDEWRKRLTAKIRSGATALLIDNLRRRLDSAAVSAGITSTTWEDRLLGASEVMRLPVRCVWIATGNNPAVSTEIARRTVRIRLDAKLDRPWLRSTFKHDNLRQWAIDHRGLLVWSALTLIRAWIAAGRPAGAIKLGMFERWSEVIGGILGVAGLPGFLNNLSEFYDESDAEGSTWRGFLAAWWERFGDHDTTTKDLWKIATDEASVPLGDKGEQSQRIVLGKMLAERRDRIFDLEFGTETVRILLNRGNKRQGAYLWKLTRA